ncbi:MAG: hypothetical protein H6R18_19 [Proteobacteria bacterium]|nr:hypothetical protein [Pseudomonadota bacterium]
MNNQKFFSCCTSKYRQNGLALMISLILLVVMSLAGIALVRSVDTGVLAAGNLAFRQGATQAGQQGIEMARQWLTDNVALLNNDNPDQGYYANSQNFLDLTGNRTTTTADNVNWDGSGGASTPNCLAGDAQGYTVCYIIHRLCDTSGVALDSGTCTTKDGARGGSSLGAGRQMGTYQEGSWTDTTTFGYYRITIRTEGPRNTVGFLQAFVII